MNFPILKEYEFAIVMANRETGIILDLNFNIYQNDAKNQEIYYICESIQKAREFVNTVSLTHKTVEFIIYNSKQEVVEFIESK
ncbi:hypothetical protein [Chryseobacterium arthrosphaerae]|uniref:Uncharacterized protein n=1 Tax=Chryseobacterium arthrosphaerae TaxID=651561 RepID=A0A1B8ZQ77_9FLAO|nr:hypothetical protein [Chryseobacterium arthrosphaerae]OCA73753.1 hypothetical protein BBI00_05080 [Chryseobacterium arthrosphaerae]